MAAETMPSKPTTGLQTVRLLFGVAILALLCIALPAPGQDAGPPTERATTRLQAILDRSAIDLSLPARGKVIVVNVPAFEALAIEDGREVLRSRIIVGTPWNPTPLVDTRVTTVRFRPTWRPTPSMVKSGEYRDRIWPPGPDNPLGLAAIRLEPPLLVYLHDTNHRELFEREDRALSHGCIRVQQWDELIAWVLGIGLPEVHRLANGTRSLDVPAPPIPVLIRYYTRFPDGDGKIVRHEDIYRRVISSAEADELACEPV